LGVATIVIDCERPEIWSTRSTWEAPATIDFGFALAKRIRKPGEFGLGGVAERRKNGL